MQFKYSHFDTHLFQHKIEKLVTLAFFDVVELPDVIGSDGVEVFAVEVDFTEDFVSDSVPDFVSDSVPDLVSDLVPDSSDAENT